MNMYHGKAIDRRSFLKRSGLWGLAATAAGLTGGLAGCPEGPWKADRAYGLTAASATVTPVNGGDSGMFDLAMVGAAGKVAWADSASVCGSGVESLRGFLACTWPGSFGALAPHGLLVGRRPGRAEIVGFRVMVEDLHYAGCSVTGTIQTFDDLWEDEESFMRGDPVPLEDVTLHLLPTSVDEEDPDHMLVHLASSVQWEGASLVLIGVSDYAKWLQIGAARLGGHEPVEDLAAEWEERHGGEPVDAWLWQIASDGAPVARHLKLLSAQCDPANDSLIFEVEEAKSAILKVETGPATVMMDGGDVASRAPEVTSEMRFTQDHLWVLREGDAFRTGLTDYALSQLGDVVYVEIYSSSSPLSMGDEFAMVESVKVIAEVYMPLSGVITARNDALDEFPDQLNMDPYGDGWLVQASCDDFSPMSAMMTAEQYQAYIRSLDE